MNIISNIVYYPKQEANADLVVSHSSDSSRHAIPGSDLLLPNHRLAFDTDDSGPREPICVLTFSNQGRPFENALLITGSPRDPVFNAWDLHGTSIETLC